MKYLLVLTLALATPVFARAAQTAASTDDKAAITKLVGNVGSRLNI